MSMAVHDKSSTTAPGPSLEGALPVMRQPSAE